jgi:hypothetical protein
MTLLPFAIAPKKPETILVGDETIGAFKFIKKGSLTVAENTLVEAIISEIYKESDENVTASKLYKAIASIAIRTRFVLECEPNKEFPDGIKQIGIPEWKEEDFESNEMSAALVEEIYRFFLEKEKAQWKTVFETKIVGKNAAAIATNSAKEYGMAMGSKNGEYYLFKDAEDIPDDFDQVIEKAKQGK